jgi:hypothetical protein
MKQPVDLPPAPERDPYQDPLSLAVVAEVVERGEGASVEGLLARAEVSPNEFAGRFTTVEDCAADAYERFIAVFERRVGGAFNAQPDWRSSLRAAAYEAADWIDENPQLVEFGNVGVLQMKNEIARIRREEVFLFCGGLIDLGRTEPGAEVADDMSAAMFAIGAIVQLLTRRLQGNAPLEPHTTVREMLYTVVRTYLGEEAAREELSLPRP